MDEDTLQDCASPVALVDISDPSPLSIHDFFGDHPPPPRQIGILDGLQCTPEEYTNICSLYGRYELVDSILHTMPPPRPEHQAQLATSESTRVSDLGKKVTEYAKAGVSEYVIIDGLAQPPEILHFNLNSMKRYNTRTCLKSGTFLHEYLGNVALSELFEMSDTLAPIRRVVAQNKTR
eukprot:IDg4317t1